MAAARPVGRPNSDDQVAEQPQDQKVEYFGEGAESIKFTPDPKAKRIRVYNNGIVLVDY